VSYIDARKKKRGAQGLEAHASKNTRKIESPEPLWKERKSMAQYGKTSRSHKSAKRPPTGAPEERKKRAGIRKGKEKEVQRPGPGERGGRGERWYGLA